MDSNTPPWARLSRSVRDTARAFLGPPSTWTRRSWARSLHGDFLARLRDLGNRRSSQIEPDDVQPVFLLSAGWRSGSTLLQRMIMENNAHILIWGEPYSRCDLVGSLAGQFRAFTRNWPPKSFLLSRKSAEDLSDSWVANLYPDIDHLIAAHRLFYKGLFADPALDAGRSQWGFKETRLTFEDAAYLRFLYPRSKIVFLCRNPFDAYLSYRNWDSGWFHKWPDRPISTPFGFGRVWSEITRSFVDARTDVDALLLRYEDLDDRDTVAKLQAYLGWAIPRASEMRRIRTSDSEGSGGASKRDRLPIADRLMLDLATRGVRRDAGYAG